MDRQLKHETAQMVKSDYMAEAITDGTTKAIVRQLVVESERKYKDLVENALVGIYVVNAKQVLYANPYLLNLLGYSESDYPKLTLDDFIEPSYLKVVIERAQQRMAGDNSPQSSVFKLICKDGRVIDVCSRGVKCIYQGEPAVLGTLLDITEQKADRAKLREFKATLDEAPVAIMHVDKSERITYCNKHLAALLRCDQRDIAGVQLVSLIEHLDPESLVTEIMQACRKKSWNGTIKLTLLPDDTLQAKATPIVNENGELKGMSLYLIKR